MKITHCRLCGSPQLTEIYGLGEQYISSYPWPLAPAFCDRDRYPLTLTLCEECELLQLAHNAPQDLLYDHYWYRSGTNETMRKALHDVVRDTLTLVPDDGGIWLDIGANDGTLLDYVPLAFWRIGVEPAINLQEDLAKRCDESHEAFWSADIMNGEKADVVTAIGMFYDLEDPNQFIADIAKVLAPRGVFVAQLMTLKQMLEAKDVGNICHEHLEYYSYPNLVRLFEGNGLEIFRVEENAVNGGSYRLYARHLDGGSVAIGECISRDDILWFIHDIEEARDECVSFVLNAVDEGAKIWVYGASTKGNVILQYYGLDSSLIEAAADRNPEKHGLVMAGTGIPIKSEEEMRAAQPDYLLMLPYAFAPEFMEREREWHDKGGQWIIPLPEFRIV